MGQSFNASCQCNHVQFEIKGPPLVRGYCHCTICQEFNQAPFADITLYRYKDVAMPSADHVNYKAYAKPEIVQRGKCAQCNKPAVEYAHMGPLGKVVIVPSENVKDSALLPEPSMHLFYNRRKADANDALPKYDGYLRSQVAFMKKVIGGLLTRSK